MSLVKESITSEACLSVSASCLSKHSKSINVEPKFSAELQTGSRVTNDPGLATATATGRAETDLGTGRRTRSEAGVGTGIETGSGAGAEIARRAPVMRRGRDPGNLVIFL